MYLNTTYGCDLLSTVPVMISFASIVLAAAMCAVVLCHCCMIVYVFHTQTMAEQATQPLTAAAQPLTTHHETANNAELCYACFDTLPDTVLIACGHRGLCSACAARLWAVDRRCPLCRRAVNGVVFLDPAESV